MNRADGPTGYRWAKAVLSKPMQRAYDIDVEGARALPAGPVILAANHRSFMDSMFLALVVDRPVSFLAKAEYFDRRRTAWMFRATGQIPVRRGSPAGALQAFAASKELLSMGGVLGVFPEGTRSRDGRLGRAHLGPARLAWVSGAPVIPVGLTGTEEVQPPGQLLPRVGKNVAVRFGSPLWIDPSDNNRARTLREFTDRMMDNIAELCGQERERRSVPAGVS